MMFKRQSHRLTVLFLLAMICACNGADPNASDSQLSDIKTQLSDLNARHQALAQRCSRITEQVTLLEAERDNLKIQAAELSHWSRQLAESFGPGLWYFSTFERPLPVKAISEATPEMIIAELNRHFVQDKLPVVVLEKIDGKTAVVQISDEQQLTQHMGTTGATAFIEVVTYSLTSLASIDFVEFKFNEGDHAIPGIYSR